MQNVTKYGLYGLKALLSAFFAFAAFGKLTGNEMTVGIFDAIGWGDWFRYVAGVVQISGAVLLWVPGVQAFGAGLLAATMASAVLFHIFILGPSLVPAAVLTVLCTIVLYAHRDQITGRLATG